MEGNIVVEQLREWMAFTMPSKLFCVCRCTDPSITGNLYRSPWLMLLYTSHHFSLGQVMSRLHIHISQSLWLKEFLTVNYSKYWQFIVYYKYSIKSVRLLQSISILSRFFSTSVSMKILKKIQNVNIYTEHENCCFSWFKNVVLTGSVLNKKDQH